MTRPPASDPWPARLLAACRVLEQAGSAPALPALAGPLGVSPAELQRQFRARLGVSPRQYLDALRLTRLSRGLGQGTTLAAILGAGFGSAAAGYARATPAFGTPPGRLRRTPVIGFWLGWSPLGWLLLGATGRGICWLAFGDGPGALLAELRSAFPRAHLHADEQRLRAWFESVRDHLLLPRAALRLPLDVQGTAFQARVWRAVQRVPLGGRISYGQLARRISAPTASRAVAGALGRNAVALLIPCHRVVAGDGSLAGYRWGAERKQALLALEEQAVSGAGPALVSRTGRGV